MNSTRRRHRLQRSLSGHEATTRTLLGSALLFGAVLLSPGCASIASPPQRTCVHSDESVEKEIGFCQALRSGDTLHVSGVAGQGKMDAAIRSVYQRLKQILEANGLSFADVVKENVYATDLEDFIRNKEIRKAFYGPALPAATWVQVQRLYLPSFVLEVELTAEYPK
jgi:enamine deaminase RidA (YjgF/YER057c/UK114 family)